MPADRQPAPLLPAASSGLGGGAPEPRGSRFAAQPPGPVRIDGLSLELPAGDARAARGIVGRAMERVAARLGESGAGRLERLELVVHAPARGGDAALADAVADAILRALGRVKGRAR